MLPFLQAEIGVLLKAAKSTEQFDLGLSMPGDDLNVEMQMRGTTEGLVPELMQVAKEALKSDNKGLAGLIPARSATSRSDSWAAPTRRSSSAPTRRSVSSISARRRSRRPEGRRPLLPAWPDFRSCRASGWK